MSSWRTSTSTEAWAWGVGVSAMLFGGAAFGGGVYLVIASIVRGRRVGRDDEPEPLHDSESDEGAPVVEL